MSMFEPADDRIVAIQIKAEEKTASGILLAQASQKKPQTCEVVAVGKDVTGYKKGDVLVYAMMNRDNTVERMLVDKDEYLFLKSADVLAKVGGAN